MGVNKFLIYDMHNLVVKADSVLEQAIFSSQIVTLKKCHFKYAA